MFGENQELLKTISTLNKPMISTYGVFSKGHHSHREYSRLEGRYQLDSKGDIGYFCPTPRNGQYYVFLKYQAIEYKRNYVYLSD
jgi:hypothetical protein